MTAFGQGERVMGHSAGIAEANAKELQYMQRGVEPDSLEALLAEMNQSAQEAAAVPRKPTESHDEFLKKLSSNSRLLSQNIFPAASNRTPIRTRQGSADRKPWTMTGGKGNFPDRTYFHMLNEFSTTIEASSRMGIPMFGQR